MSKKPPIRKEPPELLDPSQSSGADSDAQASFDISWPNGILQRCSEWERIAGSLAIYFEPQGDAGRRVSMLSMLLHDTAIVRRLGVNPPDLDALGQLGSYLAKLQPCRGDVIKTPDGGLLLSQAYRAVRAIQTAAWEKSPYAKPPSVPPHWDPKQRRMTIDGIVHVIDTPAQAEVVNAIFNSAGEWIDSKAINHLCGARTDRRVDRMIDRLPFPVQAWIDSKGGSSGISGFRWRPPVDFPQP